MLYSNNQVEDAIEIGERIRLRRPGIKTNLENLAKMYQKMGDYNRAKTLRQEIDELDET